MFLSVIDSLPTTSYIKMIEVWLIFTLLIPFKEVLILSYIHHRSLSIPGSLQCVSTPRVQPAAVDLEEVKSGKIPEKQNLLKAAIMYRDYGIPTLFVSFTFVYWTIGLALSH